MFDEGLDFANDARSAVENAAMPRAWLLAGAVAIFLAVAVAWAAFARLERITSGEGRVVSSSRLQVVQSLEPGIVAEILVAEGDTVAAGQSLVRIDDTGAAARAGELRQQGIALQAEIDRLQAQARGDDAYAPPPAADPARLAADRNEIAVFDADRRRNGEQKSIRNRQLEQRRQALLESEATRQKSAEAYALVKRELDLTRSLFERKAVPEIEFLQIQRRESELRGDLAILAAAQPRMEAEIAEAQSLIEAEEAAFRATARARLAKANGELAVVSEALRGAQDRVKRAVLKSPVAGVVNRLGVATIGEVVAAGINIVEIVPIEDRLTIETRIRPQDIAYIRPGLPAAIRLSAYDYARYGTLEGVVERIGADTITDENRQTFYKVIVSTRQTRETEAAGIVVKPGMIATVDIASGDRSVLEYFLEPVLAVRDRSLREPN
jgi:adhesin transport system membrane fusion protein